MAKRICFVLLLLRLVTGGFFSSRQPAQAQSDHELHVVAVDAAKPVVTAWAEAFNATHGNLTLKLTFVASDGEVLSQAGDANVVIYSSVDQAPAVDLECGYISDAVMLLPDLGARYIASNSCTTQTDPLDAAAQEFLKFAASPDGQQFAIDLDLLPDSVDVVDQTGATVTVPQPVRRIAAAYSIGTYDIYALGAGDRLVVANYLGAADPNVQDALRQIDPNFDTVSTAIGGLSQQDANIEDLAALRPDLILASARTGWLDAAGELGVPILRFEGESPEKLQESMTMLGAILGPDAAYRAAKFNAYYQNTLAAIVTQTDEIDNRTSVYFSGTSPLSVASGDMYQTAMINAAGGVSVAADLTGYWNDVNLEQVLAWDPDVIIYPPYGGANAESFTGSYEWSVLPAVQADRVYGMPKLIAPWDTPVPDSILGIIWLADKLYPDQIQLDCPAEVMRFYRTFYDYAIPEDTAQGLCQ